MVIAEGRGFDVESEYAAIEAISDADLSYTPPLSSPGDRFRWLLKHWSKISNVAQCQTV
jgi:hypothetical protein